MIRIGFFFKGCFKSTAALTIRTGFGGKLCFNKSKDWKLLSPYIRLQGIPAVSILVPFLFNQFYIQDPPKWQPQNKDLEWRL